MDSFIRNFSTSDYLDKNTLKGLIYEWYCYDYLLDRYKSIRFVKAKHIIENDIHINYFTYAHNGNVIYKIGKAIVFEFDVLGIKNNEIYLFEITRSKKKYVNNNKMISKINLLKIIFPKYIVKPYFVIKKEQKCYKQYNRIIIPQPNYNNDYYLNGQFKFSEKINSCISLKEFAQLANNNSLINEIIYLSYKHFGENAFKNSEKYKYVIEKLYNINNIMDENFMCYSIKENKNNTIKTIGNGYFIDNKKINFIENEILEEIKKVVKIGNCV